MPVKITANAVFAGAYTPDESVTSFGKYVYKSPNYSPTSNRLEIEGNTVFGALRFITKK